jgi:4'-phosphopantetheinyl transferase
LELEKRIKIVEFSRPILSAWELDNDIHIWKFPAVDIDSSLLTTSEIEISGRFRFAADRNRFAVGRHALRLLLSKYLSVRPEEISIISQKGQKPFINSPPCDIHFNISHSGDLILVAFANRELGIDIEKINPDFDYNDILDEHFSEEEKAFISGHDNPVSSFFYLWTRKEAMTKAMGRGLGENLKMVSVLNDILDLNKKVWKLASFKIQESYQAALAYPAELEGPVYFDGASLLS